MMKRNLRECSESWLILDYDQFSGITDERGYPLTFPSAFRQRRSDGTSKGIVKVLRPT